MKQDRRIPEGLEWREVESGGRTRSYLLFRPKPSKYSAQHSTESRPSHDVPLVIAFHGSGVDGRQMALFCGLHELGASERLAVVYPNGTGHTPHTLSWNAGNCCGKAMLEQVDDVGFVRQIVDDVARQISIDGRRIYAVGFSNGAMMAYRVAIELSETFAAIAPVGGPMGYDRCEPKLPVPVCHFHGTADDFAPYEGGVGKRSVSRCNFLSVERSISCWVAANGCEQPPAVSQVEEAREEGIEVTRTHYTGGRGGSEVILYTIHGGGHTWPGRSTPFTILGRTAKLLAGNQLIWQFFQRHRR